MRSAGSPAWCAGSQVAVERTTFRSASPITSGVRSVETGGRTSAISASWGRLESARRHGDGVLARLLGQRGGGAARRCCAAVGAVVAAGPARPPPGHSGDVLGRRARPVPFCRHGLRPPPATSPRVLWRCPGAGRRGGASRSLAGARGPAGQQLVRQLASPFGLPSIPTIFAFMSHFPLSTTTARWGRDRTAHQQHVLLSVHADHFQVLDREVHAPSVPGGACCP